MDELQKLIEAFASSLPEEKQDEFFEELENLENPTQEAIGSVFENYEEFSDKSLMNLEEEQELTPEFVEMLKQLIFSPQSSGDLVTPEQHGMNDAIKGGQEPSALGYGEIEGADDAGEPEDEVASKQNIKAKVNQEASKLKEDIFINLSDDIEKIFEGVDFSDEFKESAKTILESSFKLQAKKEISAYKEALEESVQVYLNEELVNLKEALEETIDKYLSKIVENWMEENQLAIDTGIRVEVAESIFDGIKTLISSNDIIIPEGSESVVEALEKEAEAVNEMYLAEFNRNIELVEKLNVIEKALIVSEIVEGMIDNDAEKVVALSEEVDYDSEHKEEFITKINLLKEHVSKGASKDTVSLGKEIVSEDYDTGDNEPTKQINEDVRVVLNKLKSLI